MPRYLYLLCLAAFGAILSGCDTVYPPTTSAPPKPPPAWTTNDFRQDPLRIGDMIKVELSGGPEVTPPSEQVIHEDGTINLAFIGRITANGKSPSQLEKEITDKYVPAYYTHLSVTVTAMARFFFVGGQVTGGGNGGRILYTGPITVLGAIQAAGDFTPFAVRKKVQIIRSGSKKIEYENCVEALKHPELDLPVYPGDMIQVGRRGF
jgi:protein involved in polysaccharide export with SLBB domain